VASHNTAKIADHLPHLDRSDPELFLKTMHDNMPDFNKIYIDLSVGLLTL
jgi:hypothetical protein